MNLGETLDEADRLEEATELALEGWERLRHRLSSNALFPAAEAAGSLVRGGGRGPACEPRKRVPPRHARRPRDAARRRRCGGARPRAGAARRRRNGRDVDDRNRQRVRSARSRARPPGRGAGARGRRGRRPGRLGRRLCAAPLAALRARGGAGARRGRGRGLGALRRCAARRSAARFPRRTRVCARARRRSPPACRGRGSRPSR